MKHPHLTTHFSTQSCLPAYFSAPITPVPEILLMKSMALEKYLVTFQDLANFFFPEAMFEGWTLWKFCCMSNFGVESVPIILFKILFYLKYKRDTDLVSTMASLLSP